MSDIFITRRGGGGPGNIKSIESATVTLAEHEDYAYDGEVKSVTVESVEMNGEPLILGTDYIIDEFTLSATTGGTHYAEILGIRDYCGIARGAWTIAKAPGSISIDNTSIIGLVGKQSTYELTVTGDGEITAESDSAETVGASVEGHTLTLVFSQLGQANVTVTLHDGQNYAGDTLVLSVTCSDFSISYTGTMETEDVTVGGKPCTLYKFITSGTLNLTGGPCRVWMCSGGGAGADGYIEKVVNKNGETYTIYMVGGTGGSPGIPAEFNCESGEYTVTIGRASDATSFSQGGVIKKTTKKIGEVSSVYADGRRFYVPGISNDITSEKLSDYIKEKNVQPFEISCRNQDWYTPEKAKPFGEINDGYCAGGGGGGVHGFYYDGKYHSYTGCCGHSRGKMNLNDGGTGGYKGGGDGAKYYKDDSNYSGKSGTFYGAGGGGGYGKYDETVLNSTTTKTLKNLGASGYQGIAMLLYEKP